MKNIFIILFFILISYQAFSAEGEISSFLKNTFKAGTFKGNVNRLELCQVDVNKDVTESTDLTISISDFAGNKLATYNLKDSATNDEGFGDCPTLQNKGPFLQVITNNPFSAPCMTEAAKAHDGELIIKHRANRIHFIITEDNRSKMATCIVNNDILNR